MPIPAILTTAPLLGFLLIAAIVDVRRRRIPNWLTLTIILAGLMGSLAPVSPITIGQAGAGFLVGFSLGAVLLIAGVLGGGDVKLLAGVGAWIGPWPMLAVFAASAVIAMFLVLAQCLVQGRAGALLQNTVVAAVGIAHRRRLSVVEDAEPFRSIGKPLPFAVPVALSVCLILLIRPVLERAGI